MTQRRPFVRFVKPSSIGREGIVLSVSPTAAEAREIERFLQIKELRSLLAQLRFAPVDGGLMSVVGRISANLVQRCVVTLEPVEQTLEEELNRRFVPATKPGLQARLVDVLIDEAEPPETYGREGLDVGALILEHLALGIDPYPRAPGAELSEAIDKDVIAERSPFAVLKSLGHRNRM